MPEHTTYSRRRFLAVSAMTVAAGSLGVFCLSDAQRDQAGSAGPPTPGPSSTGSGATKDSPVIQQMTPSALSLPREGRLPTFDGATGWLNSEPLTPESLRGKVVLVEF